MDERTNRAPCGYMILTPQGYIQDVNRAFLQMTGYDDEDLKGKHIETLLSTAGKIMFHSLFFPQLRLNGRIEELYLTLRDKKDGDVPVLLMGSLSSDQNGEAVDCVVVRMSKRDDYERELQKVQRELEEGYRRESKLRRLLETTLFSINEGIIVTDSRGTVTVMNELAEKFTGWLAAEAMGKTFAEIFHAVDSKKREKQADILGDVLAAGGRKDVFDDLVLVAKDGAERYIMGTAAALASKDGDVSGVVSSFRDITREYLQAKAIDSFLNVNLEMLCVLDEKGNFYKVNKKFGATLGYEDAELEGKNYLSFVHEDDRAKTREAARVAKDGGALAGFTNRYLCKDGSYKYLEWYRQPGAGTFTYSSARDVTEKWNREERLLKIAVKDQLTGLYNRHYLNSYLEDRLEKGDLENKPFTLAILDLDYFKRVNDTWGHPVGDELLKLTASIAGETIRNTDLLVRFGGEEFVVVMPQTDIHQALRPLEKVRAALEQACHPVTGRQTVSIGAAERRRFEPFADWYKRADEALYRAKQAGRNRVVAWETE